jgi:dolichyl-diphosphooligosaccharide--protein glycosyltransferase
MHARVVQYYNTLTIRLQYYDGSIAEPGGSSVVETDSSKGYGYQIITEIKAYATEAETQTITTQFNATKSATKRTYIIANPSSMNTAYLSNAIAPALQHFRLVHESPNYVMTNYLCTDRSVTGGIAWVKSFEYVPGAVIKRNGTIKVNIITNNNRAITYHQAKR